MTKYKCPIKSYTGIDGTFFAPKIDEYRIKFPSKIGGYASKGFDTSGKVIVEIYSTDESKFNEDAEIELV